MPSAACHLTQLAVLLAAAGVGPTRWPSGTQPGGAGQPYATDCTPASSVTRQGAGARWSFQLTCESRRRPWLISGQGKLARQPAWCRVSFCDCDHPPSAANQSRILKLGRSPSRRLELDSRDWVELSLEVDWRRRRPRPLRHRRGQAQRRLCLSNHQLGIRLGRWHGWWWCRRHRGAMTLTSG